MAERRCSSVAPAFPWARAATIAANTRSISRRGSSTVADAREEARLCREESDAALEGATKQAMAARALALAQLAEKIDRDSIAAP
jgi:hypothetical protein